MRVLIIEDDAQIASFVQKGLEEAGFAVDQVRDGQEGFAMATSNSYDALIVDIMVPNLDGISLVESLRKQGIDTPALILTAKSSLSDKLRAFQVGGDDYVTKPFSFAELLVRLQALIRRATKTQMLL